MKHSFTIDESMWSRGGEVDTKLLNIQGRRCCLGFAAQACGFSDGEIYEWGAPSHLGELVVGKSWFKYLTFKEAINYSGEFERLDTKLCEKIINVNDDKNLLDEERKDCLKELFAELEVEVKFINGEKE